MVGNEKEKTNKLENFKMPPCVCPEVCTTKSDLWVIRVEVVVHF